MKIGLGEITWYGFFIWIVLAGALSLNNYIFWAGNLVLIGLVLVEILLKKYKTP